MKSLVLPLVIISLAISSCKKKGCTDSTALNYNENATKDDGSCKFGDPTNPTNQDYLFTGTFNFVDRGEVLEFKGLTNLVPFQHPIAAKISSNDSILQIQFKHYNSLRWLTIGLETKNGNTIVPGTYDFATDSDIYRVSVTTSSDNDFWHAHSNADPEGILYDGVEVVKTGQLIITEVTPTKIVGTISGNLYGDFNQLTLEMQSKLVISNGAFECGLQN